ncbi:MAG: response regulator [Marinovum algicola]|uniref:response regulator n=1 Tax=Marinovum algicola TaxID=42444 RepID=UPI0032EF623D
MTLPGPERRETGPAAGQRSLEDLAQPLRPSFAEPGQGFDPASAARPDPMRAGAGGPESGRGLFVLVLAIGIGIGILLVAAVLLLQQAVLSLPLLLTVLLAVLSGPVLAGILALRLGRVLGAGTGQAQAGGTLREAAADAAIAVPRALAVSDRDGTLLFVNRRMRQVAAGEGLRPGSSLPAALGWQDAGMRAAAAGAEQPVELLDGSRAVLHCLRLPHPEGRLLWQLEPELPPDPAEAGPAGRALLAALQAVPGLDLRLLSGDPRPDGAAEADLPALWREAEADATGPHWRAVGLRLDVGDDRLWLCSAGESAAIPAVLDDLPVGAAWLDGAGRVQVANGVFCTLTGWTSAAATDLPDLVAEGERETLVRTLSAGATAHGSDPATLRFACSPERSVHFYLGRAGAAPTGGGEAAGRRLVLLVDVTQQKGVEQQFAHGQKMQAIGQLAGGVAHDFNNLLTAMIGFCDLLLQRHPPTDQSFADVQQIKQNALRAAGLVRQLLAFSRRQTLRPRPLDVVDVLADLRHLISRLIGERIHLKIVHGRNLGIVRVDRGQLEQVIINLAVNARDAMREGGSLAITTAAQEVTAPLDRGSDLVPPGRYVRIDVADTGTGVPQEHADKIFDPFFTTKKQGEGTGLVLSTVYGILRQTGGFVLLDGNGADGATFSILLPATRPDDRTEAEEAAEAGTERPPAPRDLTGRETLLLVEDEDAVRLFAARSLRNKGYTVMEAASGEAALELSRGFAGPIHALVTDVVMPNMDGPTLAQKVVADRPGMAVVFMSGYAEDAVRQTLSGGDMPSSFLQKPFTLNDLAVTVRATLSGAESSRWPSKG